MTAAQLQPLAKKTTKKQRSYAAWWRFRNAYMRSGRPLWPIDFSAVSHEAGFKSGWAACRRAMEAAEEPA